MYTIFVRIYYIYDVIIFSTQKFKTLICILSLARISQAHYFPFLKFSRENPILNAMGSKSNAGHPHTGDGASPGFVSSLSTSLSLSLSLSSNTHQNYLFSFWFSRKLDVSERIEVKILYLYLF